MADIGRRKGYGKFTWRISVEGRGTESLRGGYRSKEKVLKVYVERGGAESLSEESVERRVGIDS